jgi:hypothetical protein
MLDHPHPVLPGKGLRPHFESSVEIQVPSPEETLCGMWTQTEWIPAADPEITPSAK